MIIPKHLFLQLPHIGKQDENTFSWSLFLFIPDQLLLKTFFRANFLIFRFHFPRTVTDFQISIRKNNFFIYCFGSIRQEDLVVWVKTT